MTRNRWIVATAIIIVAILAAWILSSRDGADAGSRQPAETGGGVPAAVARVQRGSLDNPLRIGGEFKPFQAVDIHAKVAGYIRSINVDVADHVKQGQTIAV